MSKDVKIKPPLALTDAKTAREELGKLVTRLNDQGSKRPVTSEDFQFEDVKRVDESMQRIRSLTQAGTMELAGLFGKQIAANRAVYFWIAVLGSTLLVVGKLLGWMHDIYSDHAPREMMGVTPAPARKRDGQYKKERSDRGRIKDPGKKETR